MPSFKCANTKLFKKYGGKPPYFVFSCDFGIILVYEKATFNNYVRAAGVRKGNSGSSIV